MKDEKYFLAHLPEQLKNFTPYKAGKSSRDLIPKKKYLKLSSNESGYPAPPGVQKTLLAAANKEQLCRYPDDGVRELRSRLAKRHGVLPKQVVITNGSNDAIVTVARLLLQPGSHAICSAHCFAVFPWIVRQLGVAHASIPTVAISDVHPHYPDLYQMLNAIKPNTRLLYLANPDNPSGAYLDNQLLVAFLEAVPPSVTVIIDQAYFDFVDQEKPLDYASLIAAHPNVMVLRTFSKGYGLAQLRVGYVVANPSLAEFISRCKLAFSVNGYAMLLANKALQAQPSFRRIHRQIIAHRAAWPLFSMRTASPSCRRRVILLPSVKTKK